MRTDVDSADGSPARTEAAVDAPGRSEPIGEASRSLVCRHTARRLVALGGSDPAATVAPRRRAD